MARLRTDDLQRIAIGPSGVEPEIEGALAFGQPLTGRGLECFDLTIVMGRTQVLDLARTAPGGPHNLHCGRPRRRLDRAHIGHHGTLRVQI